MEYVLWGLGCCATLTLIGVREFKFVEVRKQAVVTCPQSEDCHLLLSCQFVQAVSLCCDAVALLPRFVETTLKEGLGFSIGHWVLSLVLFAALL